MSRSRRESAGAMAKPPTTEMAVQTARILRKISMTSPCAAAADSEGVVAYRSGQPVARPVGFAHPARRRRHRPADRSGMIRHIGGRLPDVLRRDAVKFPEAAVKVGQVAKSDVVGNGAHP